MSLVEQLAAGSISGSPTTTALVAVVWWRLDRRLRGLDSRLKSIESSLSGD